MKQPLLLSLILFTGALSAQITIDQGDMPSIGDNIPRKSDTMTVHPGPGGSGPNQTWNFVATSAFVINENTSIVSVASTPNGNQFSSSNMAMTSDNASYLYFNNSAQSFTTQGFAGDLLGTGVINVNFASALTLHQFPRTYGSTFTDTYGLNVTVPGASFNPLISQINFRRISNVVDETDGWGQITTPFGTYNVLRVKRTEIFTDSIFALPIFPPTWQLVSTNTDTTQNYSWFAKDGKLAVAEMSFDTLGLPKIFKWTELPGIGLGFEEQALHAVSVYPNPATDMLYFETKQGMAYEKLNLLIYNQFGSLISKEKLNTSLGKKELSVGDYEEGLYHWEISSEESAILQRGKIVIVR
jgi:hypothetical protein